MERSKVSEGILFTDFYQLTMAQLYFRYGLHFKRVRFDYFFRNYPDYGGHQAGYCINAGLEWFIDWVKSARFTETDLELLRRQTGSTGKRLFSEEFLKWLITTGFDSISIRAIPEGRVVHPLEPIMVVMGDLCMAQLLESSLLNHINYQTLVATKASRIHEAGDRRPLIEFGMRRAHSLGANAGSRAALVGGADFTSNTGLSCILGFPPKGTHSHSMVQVFMALGEGELGSFRAYAEIYPDDCLLLVDTVNTLESGVPNAITVFEELKRKGHKPLGIRLDSGDLAYLAVQSALMLDKAGFEDTVIVLSNNIDEMILMQILRQIRDEAPRYGVDPEKLIKRLVYGVGTRLITSQGRCALDGVYKITSVYNDGVWVPAMKISDSPEKTLTPGNKQVWRIYDSGGMANVDLIALEEEHPEMDDKVIVHHPLKSDVFRVLSAETISSFEPLLVDIIKDGRIVYDFPSMEMLRRNRELDLERLDTGVRRIINPHTYHVSLSDKLWNLKRELRRGLAV